MVAMKFKIITAIFYISCIFFGGAQSVSSSAANVVSVDKTETSTSTKVETETVETTTEWQTYFTSTFSGWKSEELKSEELKNKVNVCFSEKVKGQTHWDRVVSNKSYVTFLASATGYSGSTTDVTSLKNHCVKIAASKPRLLALAFKSISLGVKNKKSTLSLCRLARTKYQIGVKSSTQSTTSKWVEYIVKYFKTVSENSGDSAELAKVVENFRTADNGATLEQLLQHKEYYEYLKSVTKYTGQDNWSEFRNYLQNDFFKQRPRFIALAFKQIYLSSTGSTKLVAPSYCTNYWKKQSTQSGGSTSTKSTATKTTETTQSTTTKTTTTYTTYLTQYFKDISETGGSSSELVKVVENFRTCENGAVLEQILQKQEYYNYLKSVTRYTGQDNWSEFRNFLQNNWFNKNPRFIALAFKQIYLNTSGSTQLVAPNYCVNYWKKQSSSSSSSSGSQQSSTQQSTSTTVSQSTTGILQKFQNVASKSIETEKITSSISEFVSGSYLTELLKNKVYAKYLAACLQYKEDFTVTEKFTTYIKQKALKERPLALALVLKKIYYNSCHKKELVVPSYVVKKYQVTQTTFSVTTSTETSSTVAVSTQ